MINKENGAVAYTTPHEVKEGPNPIEYTIKSAINPQFDADFLNLDTVREHLKEVEQTRQNKDGFPVEALPKEVQLIIKGTNEYLGFHIDFISAVLLYAAAASIGNTHKLFFKNGWVESAILWIVLIGGRGTNKTAPQKWGTKVIEDQDKELFLKWEEENNAYLELMSLYRKDQGGEMPKKPYLKKTVIKDYTPEALYNIHYHNKRGLGLIIDEFAGFFKNFNRYNSGSEQESWLTMWSGGAVVKDRISKDPIRLENPCVPIIGGMQPQVLDGLAKDSRTENGFTDRILFVMPKNLDLPVWDTDDLPEGIEALWNKIAKKLLGLSFALDEKGNEVPHFLKLTPDARKLVNEWQRQNRERDKELDNDVVNGISAKIQTYCLRFSLILQLLRWACDERVSREEIDADSVKGAILLAEYFKSTGVAVATYINSKNPFDRLPAYKQDIYNALPLEFELKEGLEIADPTIKERAFKEWVKDEGLFKHIGHGKYLKVINTNTDTESH